MDKQITELYRLTYACTYPAQGSSDPYRHPTHPAHCPVAHLSLSIPIDPSGGREENPAGLSFTALAPFSLRTTRCRVLADIAAWEP